jgi:AcrR family transcriptional regulator
LKAAQAMGRSQSAGYDKRRDEILDVATRLFASKGFMPTTVADIADASQMSKSLIYYYYKSKEDILYDVMHDYVESLLETLRAVANQKLEPEERLRELCRRLMWQYGQKDQIFKVLLNERDKISGRRQRALAEMEQEISDHMQAIVLATRPNTPRAKALRAPITMLFYGMINGSHWIHGRGDLDSGQIADLACDLFLHGFLATELPSEGAASKKKRAAL